MIILYIISTLLYLMIGVMCAQVFESSFKTYLMQRNKSIIFFTIIAEILWPLLMLIEIIIIGFFVLKFLIIDKD